MQLVPDAAVGPGVQILVGRALHVEPRQLRRAAARQRKAAFVVGVAHLRKRLRFGENAEPAERIDALVDREQMFRDRGAADAVKAVAAGDDVAFQRFVPALMLEMDRRRLAVEPVDMRRLGLEQDRDAARQRHRDQILHHLLLAIDGDDLARRQHRQVDVDRAAVIADVEPRVGHALAMQPLAGAKLVHQIDGAVLQHAGADAALDIVAAARFQHHAFDAGAMQQQRAGTDRRARAPTMPTCVRIRACYCFGLRNAVSAFTSSCLPSKSLASRV